jgi:hypothetical protein
VLCPRLLCGTSDKERLCHVLRAPSRAAATPPPRHTPFMMPTLSAHDAPDSRPAPRPFRPDSTVPQSKDAFRAPAGHNGPPFQADLAFRRPAPSGLYTAARAASPFLAGSTEFTLCELDLPRLTSVT